MAKDTSKLRRKAAEQLRKGSRDKAIALLKEACQLDQYEPDNWLQLADLQVQAGDAAGAGESLFRTTDIYARCGMVREAFDACCRTLDLAPTHGPARRMGRFLISRLPDQEQDAADTRLDQAGKPKPAAPAPQAEAPAAKPAADAASTDKAPAPATPAAKVEEAAAPAAPAEAAPSAAEAAEEDEKTIERGALRRATPAAAAAADDDEKTIERGALRGAAAPADAVGDDEKTITRVVARQGAAADEEIEEQTIERGAIRRPGGGATGAAAEAGTDAPVEGAPAAPAPPEGVPEEAAELALTTPWFTGTGQPPPLQPAEGAPEPAEDDLTLPVWPPRVTLPPPPVEILTLEIEAELPDEDRPQPAVQGEIDTPPAAPGAAADSAAAAAADAGAVPEPIAATFSGPAELPPDVPIPAEPALDALSLRDLLGTAGEPGDGPVEILVDLPPAPGAAEAPEGGGGTAMRSPLLGDLDPTLLKRLVDGAELQRRRRGEVVMRQGTFGTALYVILRGEVAVVRESPPPHLTLAKLRTGAFFGEMSLITNFPRSATVVAESDLDLLVVPRKQVSELCLADAQVLRTLLRFCRGRMVATMMAVSPIFQPLGPDVRKDLLGHFRLREYDAGSEVVAEGEASGGLHIVMAGRLRVTRKPAEGEEPGQIAALGPGDVFGEMSLLSKGPAMASITAETRVWVLVLPAPEFENAVSRDHPELVAYLAAVADDRRRQNEQGTIPARGYRDGRIETP